MNHISVIQWVCGALAVIATLVGLGFFTRACLTIANRFRLGAPVDRQRLHPVGKRLKTLLVKVLCHQDFKGRPWIRLAHWLVMVSFPILFFTLVTGYAQIFSPDWALPLIGHFPPWEWLVEFIALASTIAIIGLIVVRSVNTAHGRKSRFTGSTRWQARFVEATIVAVVGCVDLLRVAESAWLSAAQHEQSASWVHFPIFGWLGRPLGQGANPDTLANVIAVLALVKILCSMTWFVIVGLQPSMGVAWHRFLAFITIYARKHDDGTSALGPLEPMIVDGKPLTVDLLDELEESDAEPNFGVSRIEQFHWKALADFSACTECGRCQDLCPAWNTGKPLSPKLFTLALRDHHAAVAPFIAAAQQLGVEPEEVSRQQLAQRPVHLGVRDGLSVNTSLGLAENSAHTQDILGALLQAKAAPSETGVATKPAPLVGEVIGEAALWACTTCGACVDQCPVDIEHIDRVIDLRRNQVLMESAFPKELGQMFRKLESKGNPWGLPPRKRLEWAKGLEFDVPVVGVDVEDASEVDYLFWVGCAGAYEDRAKKTTRAVAELLHIAGVSFAVLGDGESCTGDPARRAGNEILFQTLAAQNVETLNEVGAKRIVVTCAHCFNTISREYPQVGGNYQVLHHTQLLNQLVREGRLKPVAPTAATASVQQAATASVAASETVPEQQEPSAAASTQADSAASSAEATASAKPTAVQGLQLTPKVTYHDACYLGRHNRIYSPPRELLAATGAEQVEMSRNHERAFCCGGGGARAFMEETIGTRIAATRAREALDTGAKIVATACPFCTTMLSDGVASQGAEDVRVMDVAQLMLEAVKRGNN